MIIVKFFTLITNLFQSYAVIMSSIYYKYDKDINIFNIKKYFFIF